MNTRSSWRPIGSLDEIEPRISSHYPELAQFFKEIDYWEIKEISSSVNLRQFISSMLNYYPWWMRVLFSIRNKIARLIGLKTPEEEFERKVTIDSLSFHPGDDELFFIIKKAQEDRYWFTETFPDKHLAAWFGVVTFETKNREKTYLVITLVYFKNRLGPLYLKSILPFHHLIVNRMIKVAAEGKQRRRYQFNGESNEKSR